MRPRSPPFFTGFKPYPLNPANCNAMLREVAITSTTSQPVPTIITLAAANNMFLALVPLSARLSLFNVILCESAAAGQKKQNKKARHFNAFHRKGEMLQCNGWMRFSDTDFASYRLQLTAHKPAETEREIMATCHVGVFSSISVLCWAKQSTGTAQHSTARLLET